MRLPIAAGLVLVACQSNPGPVAPGGEVVATFGDVYHLAVGTDAVAAISGGTAYVFQPDGGAAKAMGEWEVVALNAKDELFGWRPSDDGGTVERLMRGGPPVALSHDVRSYAEQLLADDDFVFVAHTADALSGPAEVLAVPLDGGAVQAVLTPGRIGPVEQDARAIYWRKGNPDIWAAPKTDLTNPSMAVHTESYPRLGSSAAGLLWAPSGGPINRLGAASSAEVGRDPGATVLGETRSGVYAVAIFATRPSTIKARTTASYVGPEGVRVIVYRVGGSQPEPVAEDEVTPGLGSNYVTVAIGPAGVYYFMNKKLYRVP